MSGNKFLQRLRGEPTTASVVEIQDRGAVATFDNMPVGTSDGTRAFPDVRNNATMIAKGAAHWKLVSTSVLSPAESLSGDGTDYIDEVSVRGASTWLNASYTFVAQKTGAVARVVLKSSKWVLQLYGKNLLSNKREISFTLIVKAGDTNVATKTITVPRQANEFCRAFVIDFSDSLDEYLKIYDGQKLTVQLICADENASATIYLGMSNLTLLERRVDADGVASGDKVLSEYLDAMDFDDPNYIKQIPENSLAFPVFKRVGNTMKFIGWGDTGLLKA